MSAKAIGRLVGTLGLVAAVLAGGSVIAQTTHAPTTQSTPKAPPSTSATPAPRGGSASHALVDINSASAEQLDALPGVGKARSDAIIKNRPYSGKDDLVNRHILPKNVYDGIKDKIVAKRS